MPRLAEIASHAEKARLAALADPFNRTNAALKTLLSSTVLGSTRRDLRAACRCLRRGGRRPSVKATGRHRGACAAAKEAKAKLAAARAEKEAAHQVAPAQVAALLGVVVWKGG